MSSVDTNQASEDELRAEILTEFRQVHKLAPADYTENCTNVVMSLIRTEKLKLLAEVRELLIDRIPVYDGDDSFGKEYQAGYNSMAHATRTMQLQQSAELTKLEAEL